MFLSRPVPVYATDEPIAELRPAELFVICIARLWVQHHHHPDDCPAEWRAGFSHMHMDRESEAGFDEVFRLVATSAIRPLDIRCKSCPHLGEDEAWLLQLVSLLQGDRLAEAVSVLADWLPLGSIRLAIGPTQAFAAGLAARDLSIPLRHPEAAAPRPAAARMHTACTSTLLH